MSSSHSRAAALCIATLSLAASLICGIARPALGQTTRDGATPAATAAMGNAPDATDARAARKADRKAHRARTNAELSRLEKNGYNPGTSDLNYPNDLQAAEIKANGQ